MEYNVVETFHSLKGEGLYTGLNMFFIRLSGCNVSCSFCDTPHDTFTTMSIKDLLFESLMEPVKNIIITGGEPTMHNLVPLVDALHTMNYKVHLETNGTINTDAAFDWIAISPKNLNCRDKMVHKADEIKFLCDNTKNWKQFIQDFRGNFRCTYEPQRLIYLMPVTKGANQQQERSWNDIIEDNVKDAIKYCHDNNYFRYCVQLHKVLKVQ